MMTNTALKRENVLAAEADVLAIIRPWLSACHLPLNSLFYATASLHLSLFSY